MKTLLISIFAFVTLATTPLSAQSDTGFVKISEENPELECFTTDELRVIYSWRLQIFTMEEMILNLQEQNRNLKAQNKLYQDRDTSHELSHEIQKAKDAHYEEIIELKEEESEGLRQKLKREKGIRWGLIALALIFLVI